MHILLKIWRILRTFVILILINKIEINHNHFFLCKTNFAKISRIMDLKNQWFIQIYLQFMRGWTLISKIITGTGNNFRRGGVNAGRRHRHQIEVEKKRFNPMRNNSLPNRTTNNWNILPPEVVMTGSTKVCKSKFDEHMRSTLGRRSINSV